MHPLIYVPRRSLVVPDRSPRRLGCGVGCGVGGSPPPWTPAALAPSLWLGAYEEGRATRAAAPTIPGAGWTGANWAGAGLGPYLHTAGATADLTQAVLIAGNRYSTSHTISGLTAGTVTHKQGTAAGTARAANGTYTDELTAQATAAIWTPSNDFDGAVLVNAIANLSLSSYTPRIGAPLVQATPTMMPWRGQYGLTFKDDLLRWGTPADVACMHNGAGGTFTICIRVGTLVAIACPAATTDAAGTKPGIYLRTKNDNTIGVMIANDAGPAVNVNFAQAYAAGGLYVITIKVAAGANGVVMRCNGSQIGTDTLAAPGVLSSFALAFGANAGEGGPFDGAILDALLVPRVLTDAECLQAERYMYTAANNGVPPSW